MDWQDQLGNMWAQIVAFVPNLFGAALILLIGYVVARLLEKAVDKVLESVHFDRALQRGGVEQALARSGTRLDPSSLIAKLVFWTVMLAAVVMAANALELTAVAAMFERLVAYIPNVIAAVVIVVVGLVLGEFVKGLVSASVGAVEGASFVARLAKVAIVTLAVFMALDQLGVAENIVTTAFTLLLGAVALAVGLAFGLGNRELAGEVSRRWSERAEEKASEAREELERRRADGGGARIHGELQPRSELRAPTMRRSNGAGGGGRSEPG